LPDIETENGKYPMPEHAPMCNEHQKIKFVRLTYDGISCLMTPDDALDLEKDGDTKYEKSDVFITQDQFDNLPEFAGY
jgi:hypothetical protein